MGLGRLTRGKPAWVKERVLGLDFGGPWKTDWKRVGGARPGLWGPDGGLWGGGLGEEEAALGVEVIHGLRGLDYGNLCPAPCSRALPARPAPPLGGRASKALQILGSAQLSGFLRVFWLASSSLQGAQQLLHA